MSNTDPSSDPEGYWRELQNEEIDRCLPPDTMAAIIVDSAGYTDEDRDSFRLMKAHYVKSGVSVGRIIEVKAEAEADIEAASHSYDPQGMSLKERIALRMSIAPALRFSGSEITKRADRISRLIQSGIDLSEIIPAYNQTAELKRIELETERSIERGDI